MKKIALLTLLISSFTVFANEQTDQEHFLIGGYDFTTIANFSGGYSSSSPSTLLDTELNFEPALSFGYEFRESKEDSWGKAFGATYHMERELESGNINGTELTVSDPSKISMLRVYANAIYRWKNFYIPFGINFTSVNYTAPSDYTGNVDSTGGIGFNLAFGYYIDDKICIEYGAHSNLWGLEGTSGSTSIDYGDGALAVATLRLKYKFR